MQSLLPESNKVKTIRRGQISSFQNKTWRSWKTPPTSGALLQHVLRAHYQCYIWRQAVIPMQSLLEPLDFGWEMSSWEYMPICTLEAIEPDEILINTTCSCKGECIENRCGCVKLNMKCSECGCSEFCENYDRNNT